jgi:hypothetical protein
MRVEKGTGMSRQASPKRSNLFVTIMEVGPDSKGGVSKKLLN